MVGIDYQQSTDTHLSKKYNDALFNCIMTCNATGFAMRSMHHMDNLIAYFAAVENFYNNTFFLFEEIWVEVSGGKKSVSEILMNLMEEINNDIQKIRNNPIYQKSKNYFEVVNRLSYAHKLIMYGLQKRQMLVRESQQEPRGQESIKYWNTKVGFKKGGALTDEDYRKVIK